MVNIGILGHTGRLGKPLTNILSKHPNVKIVYTHSLSQPNKIPPSKSGADFFFSSLNEQTITFYLNKQAAFSSHISFADEFSESPLGSIKVKIYSSQPESLINWLAPRTEK